ncbi:hypothetical protein BX659_1903 [Orenia metallireducens]|uniref:hypothetical protein n=1 Tax=Orenia metallireducens TaxID=1413210 RepID=UPI000D07D1F4|nr:hypothetical protein [Orenia metallireducens]PRX13002.1 hypothetical protein BX659_1903 [Orenia metallireducens]
MATYEPQTIKFDRNDLENMLGHQFSTGSATLDTIISGLIAGQLAKAVSKWLSGNSGTVASWVFGISVGLIQDSINKQENMIRNAILKIADGKINGLQLTFTPNYDSNYPAVYTKWSTY